MMNKKADTKKDETKNRSVRAEEQDEFVNGCYYAPRDI